MKRLFTYIRQRYEALVAELLHVVGTLLRSKYGLWFLAAITFIDSAVGFPGPVDPFLAAYIMANRTRAWIAFLTTVFSSVLGGVFLYVLAAFFTEQILGLLSLETAAQFNEIIGSFTQGTFMIAFLGAFTPIPYGLVVIAAAVLHGSILMFIAGSILGRAIRFGIVAYGTYYFGARALNFARRNLTWASIVAVLATGLYIGYKVFF